MAYIFERKPGMWSAQVQTKDHIASATFTSRELACIWAKNIEGQINGESGLEKIVLTNREWLDIYHKSKGRAKYRGIEFNLSRQDIVELYKLSDGVCSVTKITFNRFKPKGSRRPWYPSLDRIDSNGAYTRDNCRFVCAAVNMAMGEWGEWVLLAMANAINTGGAADLYSAASDDGTPSPKSYRIPTKSRNKPLVKH